MLHLGEALLEFLFFLVTHCLSLSVSVFQPHGSAASVEVLQCMSAGSAMMTVTFLQEKLSNSVKHATPRLVLCMWSKS